MLEVRTKNDIIEEFGQSKSDTGSCEVQYALFTNRINYLTEHLKSNPKDFASRRGLLAIVQKRKRIMKYLRKSGLHEVCETLLRKLHVRK